MTQLIIEGMAMPETLAEQYQCYPEELGEFITMIDGTLTFESRGEARVITYYYEYFDDTLRKWCLSNIKKGRELLVNYLDPEKGNDLQTGIFMCTDPPRPVYYFSVDDQVYWTKLKFTLREAVPSG